MYLYYFIIVPLTKKKKQTILSKRVEWITFWIDELHLLPKKKNGRIAFGLKKMVMVELLSGKKQVVVELHLLKKGVKT